jgi:hypothetical protein
VSDLAVNDLVGWVGIGMLIAAGFALVIEGALAAAWGLALAKRTKALQKQIETGRAEIDADVVRLKAALEETKRLWEPYRRSLRWLNHPLVIALVGSFRRRLAVR